MMTPPLHMNWNKTTWAIFWKSFIKMMQHISIATNIEVEHHTLWMWSSTTRKKTWNVVFKCDNYTFFQNTSKTKETHTMSKHHRHMMKLVSWRNHLRAQQTRLEVWIDWLVHLFLFLLLLCLVSSFWNWNKSTVEIDNNNNDGNE